jgi:hypothetical protein
VKQLSKPKKPASGKAKGKRITAQPDRKNIKNLALEVDVSVQNSEDYESAEENDYSGSFNQKQKGRGQN